MKIENDINMFMPFDIPSGRSEKKDIDKQVKEITGEPEMVNMPAIKIEDPEVRTLELIKKIPEKEKESMFKKEPRLNVISKEDFEDRTTKVFKKLWEALSKSFGPYGAPTIISNYPYRHITKDGYTIMKNLSFDASETKVDQAIADMAGDICSRLNYAVGDGTTSAIIATNSIYQRYIESKDELFQKLILPRDIMKKYIKIRDLVIDKIKDMAVPIQTTDMEQLYKNIYDVVWISSNGDENMTEYIASLYKELGAPAITCYKSPDGITRKKLIDGYKYGLALADRLYINNDDKTMSLQEADVIIFSTKVTETTYKKIIQPLNQICKIRGRHLIVAAPTYDETALNNVIAPDLNTEHRKNHDINLVLTRYSAISAHTRRLINDFSVLMNTDIIDRVKEKDIIDKLASGKQITELINVDSRCIEGTVCVAVMDNQQLAYRYGIDELKENMATYDSLVGVDDDAIRLGYTKDCTLGLMTSQFTNLIYDENRYKTSLKEAEDLLKEAQEKYKKLGTFNLEVSQNQDRLYALRLKMGIIEVGADSDMSQALIKDAVDDSIKAAESAFNHGVVLGCNVNMIRAIQEVIIELEDSVDIKLAEILFNGFRDVYKTVLSNAFDNMSVNEFRERFPDIFNEWVNGELGDYIESFGDSSIHDLIVNKSVDTGKVFDVTKFKFTEEVINSLQTDVEILIATIDLISLLIMGNQMVVTGKHNFED